VGRRTTALVFLALFLAAWVPRTLGLDMFVTADERKWMTRSANVLYAVAHGDLLHTYQREHPAVTNTYLGALGVLAVMPDYAQQAPGYFNPDIEEWEGWLHANAPRGREAPLAMLAWARAATVFVVALVLTLTFFPLRRLFGGWPAAVGALFVALSPMAIAYTRQVQPDGLHSVFMYAALIFFLSWLYAGQRRRDLWAAGILMGLGWLTKTPVLFLAFIGGILVVIELWRNHLVTSSPAHLVTSSSRHPLTRSLLTGYVLWGVIASAVFFLLWPAMWIDPIGIFTKMYLEMTVYIEGHINPNFFMGQVTHDPGPLFYPIAWFFRTTPAVLVGVVILAGALLRAGMRFGGIGHRRDEEAVPAAPHAPTVALLTAPASRRAAWALIFFALVFTLLMTLPAKKFDRYLLPTFFVLDLLGSLGWAWLAGWVWRKLQTPARAAWQPLAAAAAVLLLALLPLHGLLNLPHYPYYLTYFNPLAGGTRTAPDVMFIGWGEGLDEAGRWLDAQPEAEKKRAVSWYAGGPLSYFFRGEAVGVLAGSRMPWLDTDYVVTYINQVQREIPTRAALDFFAAQTPVYTATIAGLEMARVYDMRAIVADLYANVAAPVDLPAGQQWPPMTLTALRSLPSAPVGSVLPVELTWAGPLDGTRRLSLRLIAADGTLIAQVDDGLDTVNRIQLFVPPDAAPGDYGLHLMVYNAETLDPIPTADGQQIVQVASVQVGQP